MSEVPPRAAPGQDAPRCPRGPNRKSTCITQLTLGPHVVQIWARNTPKPGPNETLVLHRVERASLPPRPKPYRPTPLNSGSGCRGSWESLYTGRAADLRPERQKLAGDARPVHLTITMIKWIRTSRLSIKNSLLQVTMSATLAPSAVAQMARCLSSLTPITRTHTHTHTHTHTTRATPITRNP